ncbi:MAG TPA: hypothetical protein VFE20_02190 [Thermoleophilia bacterium]|nr:hypothetical protein [Thermoleophilia bacterium]
MNLDQSFVEKLDTRIRACRDLPVQIRSGEHLRLIDPLRGNEVLLNPRRSQRPSGAGKCPFCTGQTPPTLFYMEAQPEDVFTSEPPAEIEVGRPRVETERESFAALARYQASLPPGEEPDPWEAIRILMRTSHPDWKGDFTPATLPGRPYLVRTFLNFVPILVEPGSAAECFVLTLPPPYHDMDIGILKQNPSGEQRALPIPALEALLASWQVLEEWSYHRDLLPIPFVNGGKNPLSGQSLECFHSQFFSVDQEDFPPLFRSLRERRSMGGCPLCAIIGDPHLLVKRFGDVRVAVHPAPSRNLTFVIASEEEVPRLSDLPDLRAFAEALSWTVRRYESLLGGVPAYVVALRSGDAVGHLHAEVVPRSLVNVPGGFEETTGFVVTTRDPHEVARQVREYDEREAEDG